MLKKIREESDKSKKKVRIKFPDAMKMMPSYAKLKCLSQKTSQRRMLPFSCIYNQTLRFMSIFFSLVFQICVLTGYKHTQISNILLKK